jgi:hypothetical protein
VHSNPAVWIAALLVVGGLNVVLRLPQWGRWVRRDKRRPVERANSFYAAPGVRRLVDLERWRGIPVERVHALNRDEVQRLLRVAEAAGPDALSPNERQFLENVAAAGATPLVREG